MVAPSSRQSADGGRIASDPQRAGRSECRTVTSATCPPIGGGVDHWVAANTGMVGVGEIADPVNHCSRAQAIASGAIRVICPINDGCLVSGPRKLRIYNPYIQYRGRLGG